MGKGEDGIGVIENAFNEFIDALNSGLDVNIGSEEYDKLTRSAAETLTSYFRKAASDLQDIKVNKANELTESVGEINKLLTQVRDLNVQIRTQGIYGQKALELRDARNLALDKLSEYMAIDVTYSMEPIDQFTEVEKLTVTIKDSKGPDGQPIKLVDGIYGGQITIPKYMPELNEKANNQAILDAIKQARIDGEANKQWIAERDQKIKDAEDAVERDPDKKKELDDVVTEATKTATAEAEKKIPTTVTDYEEKRKAYVAEAVAKARQAKMDTFTAKERAAAEAERQSKIEAYVSEEKKKAIEQYGKYKGNDGKATNDWTIGENEQISSGASYFNYDEKDPIDEDSLYLMRVEKLVDQRGRVMEDKNEPSGKSEVVALDDTTFCAKSADSTMSDLSRVDSNALGSLQAIREMLTRKGEYSSTKDIERDAYATIKRGIPYYEKALDNLAQKFAEVFNEMNQLPASTVYATKNDDFINNGTETAEFVDQNGATLKLGNGTPITVDMLTEVKLDDKNQPVMDADGKPVRVPKNTAESVEALEILRKQGVKNKGYSYYDGGVLISNRGDNNDPSGITAANISISAAWSNHSVRVLNTKQKFDVDGAGNETEHSTIRDNINHMITEFSKKRDYNAKDVMPNAAATLPVFHGSFQEVFTAISGVLADDYQETQGKVENYTISALSLENDRQSVMGVDLNDEATNMMQFSKSYAAACRLLTTIDSMLDTLINGTAR